MIATGRVDIHLFGPFRIKRDNHFLQLGISGTTRELFLYLLMNPHIAMRRQALAHLFWKDAPISKARAALSTALWRLNKACSPLKDITVETGDDLVWIELNGSTPVDFQRLKYWHQEARQYSRTQKEMSHQIRTGLIESVLGCDGHYLEDCDAAWALSERVVADELRMDAIMQLVNDANQRDRPQTAIRWIQKALHYDPYHEGLHHNLIELYVSTGQRSKAILHFEALKTLLQNELGISPLDKTLALRNNILASSNIGKDCRLTESQLPDKPTLHI